MSASAQQRELGFEGATIASDNTSAGVATIAVNGATTSKRFQLIGWIVACDVALDTCTWAITVNGVAYMSGVFTDKLIIFPPRPLIATAAGNLVLTVVTHGAGIISATLIAVVENA